MLPRVIFISIPGLRREDLQHMPQLSKLAATGSVASLTPGFPCVTCSVQANLTTGVGPEQHGVIANGFYYRDKGEVEMWTAWNECIQSPQIWQQLKERNPAITSAVWFPLHSKGAKADFVCTPAPIHNPDGSESLWCYTVPQDLYGTLRDELGHFPLMHFWGPMANIKSTEWIVNSAVVAAKKFAPRFFYLYFPHLDYAAQKDGPNSPRAMQAVTDLDELIGKFVEQMQAASDVPVQWYIASEYVITEVSAVSYPNRLLREAGMLSLDERDGGEYLVPAKSRAWALVDHQLAHVFVKDPQDISRVAELLRKDPLIERVLVGRERAQLQLDHERAGEIVLVSKPEAWFAYYWWNDDARAPKFARTVDIHQKPGYDPVELCVDMATRSIPLDATLIKGSHGYPADEASRQGILLSSNPLSRSSYRDVDVCGLLLERFA